MLTVNYRRCADGVVVFIHSAQQSLEIAMCWFTNPEIFAALQQALYRGVKVSLLLHYDHINFNPQGLPFLALEKEGAEILGYTGVGLLHYKFAIADNCKVLSGSYNWTRSNQCDIVLVVEDALVADNFHLAIKEILPHSRPLKELKNIPPRHTSFSQLYQPALWSANDLRRRIIAGAKSWLVQVGSDQEWQNWKSDQYHELQVKMRQLPDTGYWDAGIFKHWLQSQTALGTSKQLLQRYCIRVNTGDVLIAVTPTGQLKGIGIVGDYPEFEAGMPTKIRRFVQWMNQPTNGICIDQAKLMRQKLAPFKGAAMQVIATLEKGS